MALCAPFLVEETVFALFSDKDAVIDAIMRGLRGVIAGLLVVVSEISRPSLIDRLTVKGGGIPSLRLLLQKNGCGSVQHRDL